MEQPLPTSGRVVPALSDSAVASYSLLAVLVFSLGLNVWLGLRVYARTLSQTSVAPLPIERQVGQPVGRLELRTASGDVANLSFDKEPTVLYIFDPACHWCARNLANVSSLASATSSKFNFIGVSRTDVSLQGYLDVNHLNFPVLVDTRDDDYRRLDYSGTPQTLVIGIGGVVQHNWPGAYSNRTQKAIEAFFRVRLPGLR